MQIDKREDSLHRAKNHRQFLGEQLREHKIEDSLRWNYYKEARSLIIKGFKIRNANINKCVYWVRNAMLHRIIKMFAHMGQAKVK